MESKIFVQIASYRDPQLVPTIQDMLNKAKYPENLIFGICWQYDESEPVDMFDDNPNFRVAKYHYSSGYPGVYCGVKVDTSKEHIDIFLGETDECRSK